MLCTALQRGNMDASALDAISRCIPVRTTSSAQIVIVRKLAIFFPAFYTLYYIVGIIFIGGFGLPWKHLARLPFYFQWDDFRPGYRRQQLPDRELPLGAAWGGPAE